MLSGGPLAPAFENKHYYYSFKIFLCFWLARWLFWINNELIIEFGFHIIWRIMEISKGFIRLDLHYSSDVTQPHSKIVKYWSLLFILNISSFLIGWNQNLPYWTVDVKVQQSYRLRYTVNREDLRTRLSCFGSENKNVPTFYSFHQQEIGARLANNIARTARRQLEGRHLLFGEYLRSWTTLGSKTCRLTCITEDELNIDGGKHVLACF